MKTDRTVKALGERVVSSSAAMRYVMQEIARAIHTTGRHNGGPFVAVDCAKFSAQELEAHLFATNGNHGSTERRSVERVRRTAQLFQSKGGTLFLQNIVDVVCRRRLAPGSAGAFRDRIHSRRGGASRWANTRSREKPGDSAQQPLQEDAAAQRAAESAGVKARH